MICGIKRIGVIAQANEQFSQKVQSPVRLLPFGQSLRAGSHR